MVSSVIRYFLRTRRACATLLLVLLFVPLDLFAQGGPPLVTDDPGTPGNGNWEINAAIQANPTDADGP